MVSSRVWRVPDMSKSCALCCWSHPLVGGNTHQPDDVRSVFDHWNLISHGAWDFGIDQYVLKLAGASQAEWSHAVARFPRPDEQLASETLQIGEQVQSSGDRDAFAQGLEIVLRKQRRSQPTKR